MAKLDKPVTEAGENLYSYARGLSLSVEQFTTIIGYVVFAERQAARMVTIDLQRLLAELDDDPKALSQVLKDHSFAETMRHNVKAVHVPIRRRRRQTPLSVELGGMADDMVEVQ